MVEPEVAFADLADNAALAERLLKSVTSRVLNDCETDLGFFQQRIDKTVLERLGNIVDNPSSAPRHRRHRYFAELRQEV